MEKPADASKDRGSTVSADTSLQILVHKGNYPCKENPVGDSSTFSWCRQHPSNDYEAQQDERGLHAASGRPRWQKPYWLKNPVCWVRIPAGAY